MDSINESPGWGYFFNIHMAILLTAAILPVFSTIPVAAAVCLWSAPVFAQPDNEDMLVPDT